MTRTSSTHQFQILIRWQDEILHGLGCHDSGLDLTLNAHVFLTMKNCKEKNTGHPKRQSGTLPTINHQQRSTKDPLHLLNKASRSYVPNSNKTAFAGKSLFNFVKSDVTADVTSILPSCSWSTPLSWNLEA